MLADPTRPLLVGLVAAALMLAMSVPATGELTLYTVTDQQMLVPDPATSFAEAGWAVDLDGDRAALGAPSDDGTAKDAGAVYLFEHGPDGWTEGPRLEAPDVQANDRFGQSVDLHGDTLVVGAIDEDTMALDAGAAYVFEDGSEGWHHTATLHAPDGAWGDSFGSAVALGDDAAFIGARAADGEAPATGAVYAYKRTSTGWQLVEKIEPEGSASFAVFGSSIALAEDLLVVGSPGAAVDGARAGGVYLLSPDGDRWTVETQLTAGTTQPGAWFGASVATDGQRLVAGAPREDSPGARQTGAAYVFAQASGTWSEQGKLTSVDAEAFDHVGRAVGIHGEIVLAGSSSREGPGGAEGSVHSFHWVAEAGGWVPTGKLTGSPPDPGAGYGQAISVGPEGALVGAPYDATGEGKTGAGYHLDPLSLGG